MVLDFAENFTCSNQDEVQAAHWHHEQVTVHPIVTYYAYPFCEETVLESQVFKGDDRHHDFNAVFHFTKVAIDHLRNIRGLQLDHIIQWTDGCASQYKSKSPFSDISCAVADFGCTLERNYFGSRHGKGPSDSESAVVKHHAATAVKAGSSIVSNAKDLLDYCFTSSLNKQPEDNCKHFMISFFWAPSSDIQRDWNRPVKTLKGTRSLHCVKCVERNVITTCHLSCFCNPCRSGLGDCINTSTVGPWERQTLQTATSIRAPRQPAAPIRAPRQPEPINPAPCQPEPIDCAPHQPEPADPASHQPEPADLAPQQPGPAGLAPSQSEPVDPTPYQLSAWTICPCFLSA